MSLLFTFEDRLVASDKAVLMVGAPDSGMHLGWFHSGEKQEAFNHAGNFLGIGVGGPSRVGHHFLPTDAPYAEGIEHIEGKQHPENRTARPRQGSVLVPGNVYEWTLAYDPAGNKGTEASSLDRFGLLTTHLGGGVVKIYSDDLTFTASPEP